MGKKIKRGKLGNAAQYLTRNQAIKKLQLRLSEFRRLCILKGIHPREPKKKPQGANKTYYHVKDINWLLHEPLINTFRNIKVHERKVRKARAKQNLHLARRLLANKPGYKLDHLVKERYPSFIDALRDLDDPLTLVHLFATLPAERHYDIPSRTVERCKRLVMEWQAYVARTNALRKVFVSVKGFYYQAEVMGQSVTWLVPHQLSQVLPPDVDYKVMLTFLEFYSTLLQFALFKLYHGLGLRYPPVLDPKLEEAAAGLAAVMKDLAGMQQDVQALPPGATAAGSHKPADEVAKPQTAPDVVQKLTSLSHHIKALQAGDGQRQAGKADVAAESADESDDDNAELAIDSGDDDEDEDDEDQNLQGEEDLADEDEDDDMADDEDEDVDDAGSDEVEEGDVDDAPSADNSLELSASERTGGELSTSHAGDLEGTAVVGGALAVAPDDDASVCGSLFKGCVMFLAREVPREPLLFIIRSFGGTVAWEGEGSPYSEADDVITHQVVDRPTQGHRFLSRNYVQPQWVCDSANYRVLMPVEMYKPGSPPPPHLSPFVDHEQEGYTPDFALTVQKLQNAARRAREHAAGALTDAMFVEDSNGADGLAVDGAAATAAGDDAEAVAVAYQSDLAKELAGGQDAAQDGHEEEMVDEEQDEDADKTNKAAANTKTSGSKVSGTAAAAGDDETAAMKDIMMTRKNRKLYERIKRAQEGQKERADVLITRKKKLEQQQQQQSKKHKA
eukprot:jgi/Chrzof1/12692/Cz07g04070.t1